MSMLPLWVYIGLAAQALWVLGSLIDKFLIERYFRAPDGKEQGVGTLLLFSSIFSIGISVVALAVGGDAIVFTSSVAAVGLSIGVLNALWVLLYLYAIEQTEISRAVPIFQTIPIFGLLFGFVLLGETLAAHQLVGALVVIAGAFVLSYHFRTNSFHWSSFLLMLGASAVVALQETIFKVVALEASYWTSAFWLGLGFSLFGLLLFIGVPKYRREFLGFVRARNKGIWYANAVNEVIDNSANLLFSFAIILGPIALVQSVNAYQPLLILIVSYLTAVLFGNYLNEDITQTTLIQKVCGVLVITIGSILIYLIRF